MCADGPASRSESVLLLQTCLEFGSAGDWECFIKAVHPLIASTIYRRICSTQFYTPALVDDLIQDTFVKLCNDSFAALRRFRSDSPAALAVYIKVTSFRVAEDFVDRERARGNRDGYRDVGLDDVAETLAAADSVTKKTERALLLEQVDKCLRESAPRFSAGPPNLLASLSTRAHREGDSQHCESRPDAKGCRIHLEAARGSGQEMSRAQRNLVKENPTVFRLFGRRSSGTGIQRPHARAVGECPPHSEVSYTRFTVGRSLLPDGRFAGRDDFR